jgi:hypothetical protein
MLRATNLPMGVRLALVQEGCDKALLFESSHAAAGRPAGLGAAGAGAAAGGQGGAAAAAAPGDGPGGAPAPQDAASDLTVRELPLSNTLLASAVGGDRRREEVGFCAFDRGRGKGDA